uniref:AlNc14C214G8981 protein n=1 Tax=Albugo laibachii Nc14 TaxID=890382 RepID=F0WRI0_9STRA|nr:AlNc14C214G8981 [Albugo laibachii Nc14]|eukprot:CCA23943.1 AlNc14C214G8981 [Albugo laibachii Nc14]
MHPFTVLLALCFLQQLRFVFTRRESDSENDDASSQMDLPRLTIRSVDSTHIRQSVKSPFTRSWSVDAPKHSNLELQQLVLSLPGRVYVNQTRSSESGKLQQTSLAHIIIQSDSDVFSQIQLETLHHHHSGVRVACDLIHAQNLITIVQLHYPLQLAKIALLAANEFALIGHNVLRNADSVALVTNGGGNLILDLPTSQFSPHSLTLTSIGRGNLNVRAHSIHSNRISLLTTGNGNITFLTHSFHCEHLYASSAANGSTQLATDKLSVSTVEIQSSGAGNVTLSTNSSKKCEYETLSSTSTSTIDTASVACAQGNVIVSGDGVAMINVVDHLRARVLEGGKILYVNRPKQVEGEATYLPTYHTTTLQEWNLDESAPKRRFASEWMVVCLVGVVVVIVRYRNRFAYEPIQN